MRVRREVDDQQSSARCQQPADLANRPSRIIEEVQHLMDHDQIERVVRERWHVDVALAKVDAADLGALQVGARDREHRMAAVEPDCPLRLPAEQLQHPPGAGADVEERCVPRRTDRLDDRLLDGRVRRVE